MGKKKTIIKDIQNELFTLQDIPYRDFQSKLMLTVDPKRMIGVRTPALREFAKQLSKREDITAFLEDLPHQYFDEDQLHAFVISEIKDYESCMKEVQQFLPYIDNWATCDQLSPKVFKKHRVELLEPVKKWIVSKDTYVVRFAIGILMQHFLDEDFDPAYPKMVAAVRSEEYYVKMMIAWYFATALAKQYEAVLPYLEQHSLDSWTHNKTIQKCVESYRITVEQKEYLKTLRIRAAKSK